ncbi:MAG: diguanylate cyclase [Paenibacillus sp.]|nr:diguanylate cyclase [Paenibacillus sp.]
MNTLISNYIVIVAISGVLNALLAILAYYKETDFAGVKSFIVISCTSAIYTFGFALELSSNSLEEISLWLKIEYLGMPFIAPSSLIMVLHFVGLERLITRGKVAALYTIPFITALLVWTNEYHHLFYRSVYLRTNTPTPLVDIVMGPWYIVNGSFTFGCMLASTLLMLLQWNRMKRVYRRQMFTILIGLFLPMTGALLYLLGKTPYGMDPVPIIMSLTSALYIWAIQSRGMLTAAPIARENIFESMRDGVLVADRFDMLIDYNGAAAQMLQGLDAAAIGKPLAQLFLPAGKDAVSYVMSSDPLVQEEREMEWITAYGTYYYQIRSSPVLKRNGHWAGRLIMLIDVTERTLLQEKLTQLATIDSLTGIYNRTRFMELSKERLAECVLNKTPLSLILLDIDHFKSINDRYGHEHGDIALQHVVEVCSRHTRERDLFGRYGGEEFVLCLPETSLEQAGQLANTIRKDIEDSLLFTVSETIQVTASFGVVEAAHAELTLEEMLGAADKALYTSKRNGRNAVYLSQDAGIREFTHI